MLTPWFSALKGAIPCFGPRGLRVERARWRRQARNIGEPAGESVAAEVVARVPRAFVARRPFPHASTFRVCFTTTVVTRNISEPVFAAGGIASDIVPSGSRAAVVPRGAATVITGRRRAVVEAVLAHSAIVAGIAPDTAGILATAGVALDVPAAGISCGAVVDGAAGTSIGGTTLVGTTAIGTTLIGGAACTALIATARGRAAGGGALLHHPLLRAGIPAADRALRLLRPLLGRARRTAALRGRGGGRFLFAAGFLCGSGSLGGPAAPLLGGLDDFGGGAS